MRDELREVDEYSDAVPRSAATVEEFGSLRLFVATDHSFHPWYARPSGRGPVASEDLSAVLARQRELGVPVTLEWVAGRPDGVEAVAQAAGLTVRHHPLLVAAPDELLPFVPDVQARVLRPTDELARVEAVATLAFGLGGKQLAADGVGTEALDTAVETDPGRLARRAARVAQGHPVVAAVFVDGEPVSRGACTLEGAVVEITGVATLPAFRRQGLAAAVTAVLARDAVRRGARLLWVSAQDAAVARIYARLGFREIGAVGAAEA